MRHGWELLASASQIAAALCCQVVDAAQLGLEGTVLLYVLYLPLSLHHVSLQNFLSFRLVEIFPSFVFRQLSLRCYLVFVVDLGFEGVLSSEVLLGLHLHLLGFLRHRWFPFRYCLLYVVGNCRVVQLWLHMLVDWVFLRSFLLLRYVPYACKLLLLPSVILGS